MKLLFLFTIVLCLESQAAELNQNFKKRTFENPLREVSVIVGDDGFYPSTIVAFEGEKIHFFITSSTKKISVLFCKSMKSLFRQNLAE